MKINKIIYLAVICFTLLLATNAGWGQSTNDFQSVATGNWTTLTTWNRWNGTSWVAATYYPGQATFTTGAVTIQGGFAVTISANLTTTSVGTVTVNSGCSLILSGANTTLTLNTTKFVMAGTMDFSNKTYLYLPAGVNISFPTGAALTGTCNQFETIYINNVNFSTCDGTGGTPTFAQLLTAGGSITSNPTSNSPVAVGGTINLTGAYTGYIGSTPTYSWSVTAPGGGVTTYTTQNVSIPSAVNGTYQATLTVSTVINGTTYTNAKTIPVLVTSAATTLASNTVNAASVCAGATKVPVQSFTLAQTGTDVTLSQVNFTTTGTYTATDIIKFQLWTNTTNALGSATQIGTDITTGLGTGAHSFTSLTQTLTAGATRYFWITIDIPASTTNAVTLGVIALATSDFTVSSGTKSGSSSAGGTQTFDKPTVSGPTSVDAGYTITLTGSGTPHGSTPWASSNTAIATVSSTGVVTGVAAGTVTITYMDSNGCTATHSVTVNPVGYINPNLRIR